MCQTYVLYAYACESRTHARCMPYVFKMTLVSIYRMKEDPASLRNFDRSSFFVLFDNVPPLINKDQDTTLLHAISEEERLTVTLRYLAADNICSQGILQHRVVSVFLQRNVPPTQGGAVAG